MARATAGRGSPHRRGLAAAVLASVMGLAGCGDSTGWQAIPASPDAQLYEGAVETLLDTRLASRVAEGDLDLLDQRLEHLPAGTTWQQHLDYRTGHAGGLEPVVERVPEPDAPVPQAEYAAGGRTLFVIGAVDGTGERLVVLTALAES